MYLRFGFCVSKRIIFIFSTQTKKLSRVRVGQTYTNNYLRMPNFERSKV